MYKNMDDIPITFGPVLLAGILGISRNKTYELVNRVDFPKYHMGKKNHYQQKAFYRVDGCAFLRIRFYVLKLRIVENLPTQVV